MPANTVVLSEWSATLKLSLAAKGSIDGLLVNQE
jgi:hypothetical protein